jgi:hypothetical protein
MGGRHGLIRQLDSRASAKTRGAIVAFIRDMVYGAAMLLNISPHSHYPQLSAWKIEQCSVLPATAGLSC